MSALATALSAFSARATRGRRIVLLGYSAIVTLTLLGLAWLISTRAAQEGVAVDVLQLADMFAMIIVTTALFVVAPAMVAAQVAEERRHATLDLLRTAPLSPTALVGGFLVGAPGALYLLLPGPLALHVAAGLAGRYPFAVLPQSLLILGIGCLATMLFAIVAATALGREAGGAAPLLLAAMLAVGGLIAFGMALSPESSPWAFLHPAGGLALVYQSFDGPFRDAFSSPWRIERMSTEPLGAYLGMAPALCVLAYTAAAALLLSAARRLLATDAISRLEKPIALALFTLVVAALIVPLRAIVSPANLGHDDVAVPLCVLVVPYLACVLAVTPSGASAAGARGGRLSPTASPHATALLMVLIAFGTYLVAYGSAAVHTIDDDSGVVRLGAFTLLALTAPIYAQWASTRIHTGPARLAFWALIVVHAVLQIPAIVIVTGSGGRSDVPHLLAQVAVGFGVFLPLFITWRQRVAARAPRVAAAI